MDTFDIPGPYLHTETDEEAIIVLEWPLSEFMDKLYPKLNSKYVTINIKWKLILYVNMYKALYGLLRGVLLFYKKLVSELELYGFVINSYDPCVANTEINISQITVVCHVDHLKFSHKDPFEVTRLAAYLTYIYGGMKVNLGEVHYYLGMDLD